MSDTEIANEPTTAIQQQDVAREFDEYNEVYEDTVNQSLSFSNLSMDGFVKAKADDFLAIIEQEFDELKSVQALDVGCGVGVYHSLFKEKLDNLSGIDVSEKSIEKAKRTNPEVSYKTYDGIRMPYADDSFDAVTCICVLHHVPVPQWTAFTAELLRVLKPGGLCFVYEHNPWNPLTLKVVKDCPFDEDAVLLSAPKLKSLFRDAQAQSVTARFMLAVPHLFKPLKWIDQIIGFLPVGSQYRVIARKGA